MKTLLLGALLLAGCTFPSVVYVPDSYFNQPSGTSDAAFWMMHQNSVNASQPQPPRIPQWCRNPISHTVDPC